MSIADYIFADVSDVSGQDNTNACECISSISFEQRTLKSRGDYERKALWSRGGVSRTPVFNPVFSTRVSLLVFTHAQCVMVARQPFGLAQGTSQQERVSASSACSISSCCCVCPGLLHARYTDVLTVFLSIAPFLVWMV